MYACMYVCMYVCYVCILRTYIFAPILPISLTICEEEEKNEKREGERKRKKISKLEGSENIFCNIRIYF